MAAPPPSKPAPSRHHKDEARRRFLRSLLGAGAVLGVSALGYLPVARAGDARLRPPGALEEDDFLASCIKCGQCVQVCPVEALKLADMADGYGIGAPFIAPRDQACDFSCDAAQCILACPTGALTYRKPPHMAARGAMRMASLPILLAKEKDPEPTLNLQERMGLARLARPDLCLARQGRGHQGPAREAGYDGLLRFMDVDRWKPIRLNDHPYASPVCDLCVRACPIKGAISLDKAADGRMTPVVHEACVGCGVCEMVCPTAPPAIVVDARAGWRS